MSDESFKITQFPITTLQMNKWKIGVYKTNHNKGNCNFL